MKKALLLLILMIVPCLLYAEFQIGPTALYGWVLAPDEITAATTNLSLDDFSFGADARFTFGMLQASAFGLFSPAFEDFPAEIELYLDGGLALDFVFLRLALGLGPNFIFVLDEGIDEIFNVGGNVKLSCDLMLGSIDVGLYYLMFIDSFSAESLQNLAANIEGNIGLSVLFKLF